MVSAAIKGVSKILRKGLRKAPILGKYARGTPTKAGLVSRRAALRGTTPRDIMGPVPKGVKAPTPPSIKKTGKEVGKGAIIAGLAYAAGKAKATKEAEAKQKAKDLEKSTKEHKKKTEEKRKKYGKHHG